MEDVDANPGPHIVIRGNLAYGNFNSGIDSAGNLCWGTTTMDGEGIIVDTPGSPEGLGFKGLTVVESNIVIGNGGAGIACTKCNTGKVLIRNNTAWNNGLDKKRFCCSYELGVNPGSPWNLNVDITNNIAVSALATGAVNGTYPGPAYALWEGNNGYGSSLPANHDTYEYNVAWNSAAPTQITHAEAFASTFFTPTNKLIDPKFASPTIPSPPNCAGYADVRACIAGMGVVKNFKPTNTGIKGSGSNCAPYDITGKPWTSACDPGAINLQ